MGMVFERRRSSSLLHVLQWAFLAEVVSQVFLPPLTRLVYRLPGPAAVLRLFPERVNTNIILLNHVGAILAGLVTALAEDRTAIRRFAGDSDSDGEFWHDSDDEQQDSLLPGKADGHAGKQGRHRRRGGRRGASMAERCADGFKRGFVAVLTSYLAAVEHMGELLEQQDHGAAALVFLGSFVGGPALFTGAVIAGRRFARWAWPRKEATSEHQDANEIHKRLMGLQAHGALNFIGEDPVGVVLKMPRPSDQVGDVSLTTGPLAVSTVETQTPAPGETMPITLLWWQLPWGLLSVGLALVVADRVSILMEQHTQMLQAYVPGVDCPTVAANAATLVFGHAMVLAESCVFAQESLARLVKVHSTVGGTLSAYGGFAEAVAWPALAGQWRRALLNWVVHAYLALMGAYFVIIGY